MIPLVAFVYQIKKNLMIRGLADVGQEKDKMVNEQLRYLIVNPNSYNLITHFFVLYFIKGFNDVCSRG